MARTPTTAFSRSLPAATCGPGRPATANAQSARHPAPGYGRLAPAGTGLRLRLSKKVGPYLAVDYAWGLEKSRGVFFNLGEVF